MEQGDGIHAVGDDGRVDLYVYNEATAWTLSSRQLILDAPLAEDQPWDGALADGRMMAMTLYQDDSFHVRVVLGDLSEAEEESWIGRARWWLRVPDGVLVVAAGSEFVGGLTREVEEYGEFVHPVAVPPGDYHVDVYTTLTGVNGLWALERAGMEEPLGAWWRRTRPGEDMPAWLQSTLLEGLSDDPGHEEEWKGWSTARYDAVMDAVERGAWIDWIVQLRPLDGDPPTDLPELDEGCLTEPELRIPQRCPPGIAGSPVNADESEEPEPARPVDVLERLAGAEAEPVTDAPVAIPAEDVEVAARVAWFADRSADGEVLIDCDALGPWAEDHLPTGDVFLRTAPDGRLRVGFPETHGVYDLLDRLRRCGPAFAALPDGASLELVTAGPGGGREGALRLAGTIRDGTWHVERAHPAVEAETLSAALELAREARGETVRLRDEDEIEQVRERWRAEGMQRVASLSVSGLSIGHDEGTRFTYLVAAAVFAVRFGHVWPCPEPDDPLADSDEDDEDDLFASLGEHDFSFEQPLFAAGSGRAYIDVPEGNVPHDVQSKTDPLLRQFEQAGAVRVGDLMCSSSPAVLVRGVADERARYFGSLLVAPYVDVFADAYTLFTDGSSLTTTTNPSAGGGTPEAKIRWNTLPPGTEPRDVVDAHLAAVETHASEHGVEVVPVRQNLLALAEAIEEFLVRRLGG